MRPYPIVRLNLALREEKLLAISFLSLIDTAPDTEEIDGLTFLMPLHSGNWA